MPVGNTNGGEHMFASVKDAGAITLDVAVNPAFNAVYVGTAGDLNVTLINGTTITFPGVPAGAFFPVCGTMINTVAGTATDLIWVRW